MLAKLAQQMAADSPPLGSGSGTSSGSGSGSGPAPGTPAAIRSRAPPRGKAQGPPTARPALEWLSER